MQGIIKLHKTLLQNVLLSPTIGHGFKIIIANKPTWEFPIPEELQTHQTLVLDVIGQTLEDSYPTDDGYFLSTTFGDDVINTKLIPLDDIVNIISLDGKVLYQKTLMFEEVKPRQTRDDVPQELSEGQQYSMMKILERNAHLKKYQKDS